MTIKIGDKLPNATFRLVTPDGAKPVTTRGILRRPQDRAVRPARRLHPDLPQEPSARLLAEEAAFKAKGVDEIAVTAVNDHHVFAAWAKATGAEGHIAFLADGSADFAKAAGLDFDASGRRHGRALAPLFDADRERRRQSSSISRKRPARRTSPGAPHLLGADVRGGGRQHQPSYAGLTRVSRMRRQAANHNRRRLDPRIKSGGDDGSAG